MQRRHQQLQATEHPPTEHQRHRQQGQHAHHQQADGDAPAQIVRRHLHRAQTALRHALGGLLRLQQPPLQRLGTVARRTGQTAVDQLAGIADQTSKTLIQRLQLLLDGRPGQAQLDLADLRPHGIDVLLEHIHLRIARRRIDQLVQWRAALPRRNQSPDPRIAAIEVPGQTLPRRIVVNRKKHRRVALGNPRKGGQGRHIVVPDGLGRDTRQQLRHGRAGLLEIGLQHATQLFALGLQTPGQGSPETLASLRRQRFQPLPHFALSRGKLSPQTLAVVLHARRQIAHQVVHRGAGQPDRQQHLQQHGDTQGDKHRTQQATMQ